MAAREDHVSEGLVHSSEIQNWFQLMIQLLVRNTSKNQLPFSFLILSRDAAPMFQMLHLCQPKQL